MNALDSFSNRIVAVALTALVALPLVPSSLALRAAASVPVTPTAAVSTDLEAAQNRHAGLPLAFEANHGQADASVLYVGRGTTMQIALTRTSAVYAVANGDTRLSIAERYSGRQDYLGKVRRAADDLVRQRFLRVEDMPAVLQAAERMWNAVVQ